MKERCLQGNHTGLQCTQRGNAEFADLAADHLDIITPKVRHAVMKSAWFYEKGEHTQIIKEINEELKKLPVHEFTGRKVVLTGISCEPDEILDILERTTLQLWQMIWYRKASSIVPTPRPMEEAD